MKKWIAELISGKKIAALPIMTHPGIEMIGRTVHEAVTDGKVHYEAVKTLSEKYPAAACTVIMDLTVEAEAFGAKIAFARDEVPSVVGAMLSDGADIDALRIPSTDAARVPQFLLANRLIAENVTDRPVFAGCIGSFSLAGRLYDMTNIMMAMYVEPENVKRLLEKCTEFLINYCRALKETGVNGLIIAEPAAGLLSNEDCMEFSSVYVKKIVEAVQDDRFAVILHNCGNQGQCTEAMLYTGAAGYHFGNRMDMPLALEQCPPDVLVMGNIDPVGSFKMASPDEMYRTATNLLEKCGGYPNFVLSSGCDTPPEVPFANIDAFYKALDDYNKTTA